MKDKVIDFPRLGIKSVDLQHEKFFALLNELKLYDVNHDDIDAKVSVLQEFKAFSKYHFELEIKIMEKIQYEEIYKHREQHEYFMKKIEEFEQAYKYQSATLSEQMLDFLQKWFLVHIVEWDSNYVTHYNEIKNLRNDI